MLETSPWCQPIQELSTKLIMPCSLNAKQLLITSSRVSHHLKGISPLRPPLPGKAIKANFFLLLFSRPVVFTLCDPMDCSMPLLCPSPSPRVCPRSCSLHWWCCPAISSSDASPPSALNLSQHQGLFQWVICLHQMTKILKLHLQHQSLQYLGMSPLRLTGLTDSGWLFSASPKTLFLHFYLALVNRGRV